MMTNTNSLADRFAWLFDGLCRAIGVDAHKRRIEAALAWAVWNRVRLLGDRLIALLERLRAGQLPATLPARRPGGSQAQASTSKRAAPRPAAPGLPREFGWMRRELPETAQYAGVLAYFLRDPEVAALVENSPQAARILRPLCRLLGVRPPEVPRRPDQAGGEPSQRPAPPPPAESPPAEVPRAATPLPAAPPRPRPGGLFLQGGRLVWG